MKKSSEKKSPQKIKIGVVYARFNDFITKRLLDGCVAEFKRLGVEQKQLVIVSVPGAFELPLAAQKLVQRKDIAAVVALGAVIRGETFHFELVARAAGDGILKVGLDTGKPVIFGVLTTDTVKQAYERAQVKGDNKGRDAAQAAMDMIKVINGIEK